MQDETRVICEYELPLPASVDGSGVRWIAKLPMGSELLRVSEYGQVVTLYVLASPDPAAVLAKHHIEILTTGQALDNYRESRFINSFVSAVSGQKIVYHAFENLKGYGKA